MRPRSFLRFPWARLGFLAALAAMSCAAAPPPVREPDVPDIERAEAQVVAATNAFRDQEGRPALRMDATLHAAAQRFAQFMARTGEYGHEADGLTPGQRLRREGYAYCMVAENIAFAYDSRGFRTSQLAEKMMAGWKASPGHRRNLLDKQAAVIGVAIARSKADYYYAVQLFARPMKGSRCQ